MKEKIKEYLKNKGLDVEKPIFKYLENGIEISEKDEYMHNWGEFPEHHNESWYFNFIDRKSDVFFITRISFVMGQNKSQIMMILIIDKKINTYLKEIPLEEMPDNLEFDKKIKYYCIKPFDEWRITFEDRKHKLNINLKGRFPVHNSAEGEDPIEMIEEYGLEILDIAGQQHYEQPMIATGTLIEKKKDAKRNINALGHRDHSWGTRDWVNIDGWNWVDAQFPDMTINFFRSRVFGKTLEYGTIFEENNKTLIKGVEVSTVTEEDGKTPRVSTFTLTDENGKERSVVSRTIKSLHFPVPGVTKKGGFTEIYEQISVFEYDDKEGDGISEHMISTRK
ncbi:MAG: hypothetical protein GF329_14145 [Candidatus Lokiarchaeota archaeon]|nr:hypothetical protein [Candidatus Lokiarchaeota archaeon]